MNDSFEYFAEVTGVRTPFLWKLMIRKNGAAAYPARYHSDHQVEGQSDTFEEALAAASAAAHEFEEFRRQQETKRTVPVLKIDATPEVNPRTLEKIPVMDKDPIERSMRAHTPPEPANPFQPNVDWTPPSRPFFEVDYDGIMD